MMRKSTVMIAGKRTRRSSTPASTSRVTVADLPSAARRMLARKVACGQPNEAARIWPTWLSSPSTACLPMITRSGFSASTTARRMRATRSGSSALSSPAIRVARLAPMASSCFSWAEVSLGPMLTTTTSPTRSPPLPSR